MRTLTALLGFFLVSGAVTVQARKPVATKFDQFEKVGYCDLGARLDNFTIQLQNTRGAQANIISYGPEGEGPATGRYILNLIKDYLVNVRGLNSNRVKTIYGGRNTDLTQPVIELWIVPQGAASPEPQKYETHLESFQGLFADEAASDNFDLYYEEEMGPGIPGTTEASFADILHQQKNATGFIVVYSGEDLTPGAWRRIAQSQVDYFKAFKLEAKTVRVFFVVRLEQPVPEEPSVEIESEPIEDPAPLDLTKLVEKWRLDLTNTQKISADRFIIVFAPTREFEGNQLSLWVVPKGQPLPDSNESEEDSEVRP